MPLRVIQSAPDSTTLVVVYKLSDAADQALITAAPNDTIVNVTGPAAQGYYARLGDGESGILPLPELVQKVVEMTGSRNPATVILAGHSEGCEALLAQLQAGHKPQALVASDGIQLSRPGPQDPRLPFWQSFVREAEAGDAVFFASTSGFLETKGLPVADSLSLIFGVPSFPYGTADAPAVTERGLAAIWAARSAHQDQGLIVLPQMIAEAVVKAPERSGPSSNQMLAAMIVVALIVGGLCVIGSKP